MDSIWASHDWTSLWGVPIPPAEKLWLFVLILARVSGLVTAAPLFSAVYLPLKFRALLALGLSALLLPAHWYTHLPPAETIAEVALLLASQWLVGVAVGMGFGILFSSLQLAGELAARTAGLMLADMFDPLTNTEISPLAQLCAWIATAVLFVTGAYRWLVGAILDSFVYLPVTDAVSASHFWPQLLALTSQSFIAAMRIALPVLLLLTACTLILGFVARTFPQLNILAVGLGVNGVLTLLGLAFALGGMIAVFADELHLWQELLAAEFFRQTGP